jgi:ATP-dependent helicase IRC3
MNLRPYQRAALQTSKDKLAGRVTRQLIALPTGTGKTPIIACAKSYLQLPGRVMVLAHRDELIQQAVDKIKTWNPTATVGIEQADETAGNSQFVVASVATLGRAGTARLAKFRPEDFSAVICDEAHHSTATSYLNIFNYFGLLDQNSTRLLLGVTATPNRGDGVALGKVYDEIIYQMTMLDAIRQGWLVDLRGIRVRTDIKLDGVHTLGGDFQQGELAKEVNTKKRNELIVQEWLKHAKDRQTVAFTVDIAHANDLATAFKSYGVSAESIWGDDPARAEKLAFHRKGSLRVLCNCSILTEGYDDPNIGCIVMARPTKSNLLFVQMAGRGTRLQAGINNLHEAKAAGVSIIKEDCLLMDVVDNTSRHSLITLSSIFGLGNNLDLKGAPVAKAVGDMEEAQKKNPNIDFSKLDDYSKLTSFTEQVNLFEVKYATAVTDNSLLQWHQSTDQSSFVLLLPNKENVVITQDLLGKHHVVGTVNGNKFQDTASSLPEAFRTADSFVTTFGRDIVHLLKRQAKWHNDPPTPGQIRLLNRFRVPIVPGMTKGDATKKINQFFATGGKFMKRSAA